MKLHIKNMVCNRCVMVVNNLLEKNGLHPVHVGLGEVTLQEEQLDGPALDKLDQQLAEVGFERIDDRKVRIIEKIKSEVIGRIHHQERLDMRFNWSAVLADALHYDYNYLSSLFSSVEGVTLEHYIINQKIEKAKELLFYDELNLSEIADRLGYSSVQHLSTQFRKITGFTPSVFRKTHRAGHARKPIDQV